MDTGILLTVEAIICGILRNEMDISMPVTFMLEKNRWYVSCAIENPKKIGYFKEINDHGWNVETRKSKGIMVKPGKFFKHLFPDAGDTVIQKLVSKYYAAISQYIDTDWSFFVSDNIKKYYHEKQYISCSGSLGCSCMKYAGCQDYLEFYDNYDVSILVLKNADDMIKGRALIWKNVFFPKLDAKKTFMDRVYTTDDNDVELFRQYAIEHDFVMKERQSMSAKGSFQYKEKFFWDTIETTGDSEYLVEEEVTPYLDTFSYSTYDGELSNDSSGHDFTLESTEGRIRPQYTCDRCGAGLDDDSVCFQENDDNTYCGDCFNEAYTCCKDCEEYVDRDYIFDVEGRAVCEYCRDNNYTICECCEEYFTQSDMKETVDGDYICSDCARSGYTKCDICGLYEGDKYIEQIDGQDYCSNCAEEIEKVTE